MLFEQIRVAFLENRILMYGLRLMVNILAVFLENLCSCFRRTFLLNPSDVLRSKKSYEPITGSNFWDLQFVNDYFFIRIENRALSKSYFIGKLNCHVES